MATNAPITPIDYTSRDYASLREDLIKAVQLRIPQWTADDPTDFGLALLESFAYMGDIMSYYIDRAANEAFLTTATQRESISAIAKTLGYFPASATAASVRLRVFNPAQYRKKIVQGTTFVCNVSSTDQTKMLYFEAQRPAGTFQTVAPTTPFVITSFQDNGTNKMTVTVSGDAVGSASDELTQVYHIGDLVQITRTGNSNIDGTRVLTGGQYDTATGRTELYFASSGTAVSLVSSVTTNATVTAVNLITATEGKTTLNQLIGLSNGSPDQEFILQCPSLIEDSVRVICGTPGASTAIVGVDSADPLYGVYRFGEPSWETSTRFNRTTSTSNLTPYDNVFYLEPAGKGEYAIRFGDGVNGTIPEKDSGVYVTYRTGGGIEGNIAINTYLRGPGSLTAAADSSGYGGAPEESIEEIRRNATSMFRSRDRAVSTQDFSDLALTDPFIVKASARSASTTSSSVYLAPSASSDDPAPGYVAYRVRSKAKSGTLATLSVVGLPISLVEPAGTFVGYVSGLGPNFDSPSVPVTFTVISGTQVTYTAPASGTVSEVSCSGVITNGYTDSMTAAVTRVKNYIEKRSNAGMTVTVSPVIYKDVSLNVTVFLRQGIRRSVGMKRAKNILSDLFSYNAASISGAVRREDILLALSGNDEIEYSQVNQLRITSDSSPSDTAVVASSGEILRLLDGTETWSASVTGSYIDTYTTGNIVIRLGGETGVADF